jgi:hypothetical protein
VVLLTTNLLPYLGVFSSLLTRWACCRRWGGLEGARVRELELFIGFWEGFGSLGDDYLGCARGSLEHQEGKVEESDVLAIGTGRLSGQFWVSIGSG